MILFRSLLVALMFLPLALLDRKNLWPNALLLAWAVSVNRPEFVDRLVTLTLQTHSDDGGQLRKLVSAQDINQIERLAHELKAIGGNLCAPEVQMLVIRTMNSAQARDPDVFLHAAELADAVDRMTEVLKRGRPQ